MSTFKGNEILETKTYKGYTIHKLWTTTDIAKKIVNVHVVEGLAEGLWSGIGSFNQAKEFINDYLEELELEEIGKTIDWTRY